MKKFIKIVFIIFVVFIGIGIIGSCLTDTESSTEPESSEQTKTKQDIETRNYIWNFLLDKGYKVDTTLGVPNIGKKEINLGEGYEGWYAIMKDGKEYSIILYKGEIMGIQPVK